MSKYRAISGPYFPVFGMNTGKYGPEVTLYLDTFDAVKNLQIQNNERFFWKYNSIHRLKCNAYKKTQGSKTWLYPFIKLFTSSGSSIQID